MAKCWTLNVTTVPEERPPQDPEDGPGSDGGGFTRRQMIGAGLMAGGVLGALYVATQGGQNGG